MTKRNHKPTLSEDKPAGEEETKIGIHSYRIIDWRRNESRSRRGADKRRSTRKERQAGRRREMIGEGEPP